MDLKQIEYFVRVAELGSFTRASAVLGIAQPALSRQVRLLEVELRQNLLVRNGRGALPTEAGKLLLEHGRGILHQVRRAREEIGRSRGALAGRVSVGLPPSVARVLAVPLSRAFRDQLPQATLSISEGLSIAMRDALIDGRLDIALLHNAAPAPDIELVPLLQERLFLVRRKPAPAAASVAITLAQLATIPLVIPSRPNAIRMLIEEALAGIGQRAEVALEIDGVSAILDLVADGAGGAVLSRNAVAHSHAPAHFDLTPIGSPPLTSHLFSATSAQRPVTPTQRAMLELISRITPELVAPCEPGSGAAA